MKWKLYCLAQIKRVMKMLPSLVVVTFFLITSIAVCAMVMLQADASREEKTKVQIGIVGETQDTYLGFGISALKSLDSSRFAIDFIELSRKEAEDAMNAGTISAYVIIPEGFFEAALVGENIPLTYVPSSGAMGVTNIIMKEVVNTISILLTESQGAIYGMQHYAYEHNEDEQLTKMTNAMFLRFIQFILGRSEVYQLEEMGVSGQCSMIAYYLCSFFLLLLLLLGIVGCSLYVKKDTALIRLATAKGNGALKQVLGELVAYGCMLLLSSLLVLLVIYVGIRALPVTVPEWGEDIGVNVLVLSLRLLPVLLVVSAMQMLLFEVSSNLVTGILLQFISAIGLGYLSGLFYPISFFPRSIQSLQYVLPTGVARCYLQHGMAGKPTGGLFLLLLFEATILLGLTVLCRKHNLQAGRG